MEEQISAARERLEGSQQRHHAARLKQAAAAADGKLFATLDFTRQQIEDFERLVARLREARGTYSKSELEAVKAQDCEPIGSSERSRIPELFELVRRASRRKLELQGRQQWLLANQRQAEQDRNYARKALDQARGNLLQLQAERLQVCQERYNASQEASQLASSAGLGSSVLKDAV
ncbi:unnamed protein product [Effrenium voratum]|nr:unnamed protein product [Effrenium voratum]